MKKRLKVKEKKDERAEEIKVWKGVRQTHFSQRLKEREKSSRANEDPATSSSRKHSATRKSWLLRCGTLHKAADAKYLLFLSSKTRNFQVGRDLGDHLV